MGWSVIAIVIPNLSNQMVQIVSNKDELSIYLSALTGLENAKVAVLVDSNTLKYCYPLIAEIEELHKCEILEVEPGEDSKSLEIAAHLWQSLQEFEFNRTDFLICLGGGVITDLGGFIASTFKRGMRFVHIPTSYTGMVDAAIGGKQGLNFNGVKNQIGVFSEPIATLIYPEFLETLPERELNSGYIETIKHALISNGGLWNKIVEEEPLSSTEIVRKSTEVKQGIVEQDPNEKGIRKALNFGHTVGHAFEAIYKSELLHGEAVAIGLLVELQLSVELLNFPLQEYKTIQNVISNFCPITVELNNVDVLIELMKHDKKNDGKGINFTLLNRIGGVEINQYVAPDAISSAIKKVFGK